MDPALSPQTRGEGNLIWSTALQGRRVCLRLTIFLSYVMGIISEK